VPLHVHGTWDLPLGVHLRVPSTSTSTPPCSDDIYLDARPLQLHALISHCDWRPSACLASPRAGAPRVKALAWQAQAPWYGKVRRFNATCWTSFPAKKGLRSSCMAQSAARPTAHTTHHATGRRPHRHTPTPQTTPRTPASFLCDEVEAFEQALGVVASSGSPSAAPPCSRSSKQRLRQRPARFRSLPSKTWRGAWLCWGTEGLMSWLQGVQRPGASGARAGGLASVRPTPQGGLPKGAMKVKAKSPRHVEAARTYFGQALAAAQRSARERRLLAAPERLGSPAEP